MCRAAIESAYYNQTSNECFEFLYGGCGATANIFSSKEDCVTTCINKSTTSNSIPDSTPHFKPPNDRSKKPYRCTADVARNFHYCFRVIPSFFYDNKSNQCIFHYYGGCRPVTNIFHTRYQCENFCKDSRPSTPPDYYYN